MNIKNVKVIPTLVGIIIIVVWAIIALGGALSYQYFTPKIYPVIQSQQVQNQTADWKTFKSGVFDYELQFPSEYDISPGFISTPHTATDIDEANYSDRDYSYIFRIFARSEDFIIQDCLKDLNGKGITKTININGNKFYIFKERQEALGLKSAIPGSMESEYKIMRNSKCYIVTYGIFPLSDNVLSKEVQNSKFNKLDQIVSTFKFTTPVQISDMPVIDSISPSSGLKGTVVEIRGKNLSGFEGDLDLYFERTDGKKVMLSDSFGDYAITQDRLIKVKIIEPCQAGEKVIGRYSGIETECNYVELMPGIYKVYAEPYRGKKTNIVNFEIIK